MLYESTMGPEMSIWATIEPLSGSRRYNVPAGWLESQSEPCPNADGYASTPSWSSASTLPASGRVPSGGGSRAIGVGCGEGLSPRGLAVAEAAPPGSPPTPGTTEVVM